MMSESTIDAPLGRLPHNPSNSPLPFARLLAFLMPLYRREHLGVDLPAIARPAHPATFSTASRRLSGAKWEYFSVIAISLCPSSSLTV